MDSLKEWLAGFAGRRVLVVGDLMLDEQIHGSVERISPEAPVPVVEITGHVYVPGGAANVAANMAALGAAVTLGGVVGDDGQGLQLQALLEQRGITARLEKAPGRPTITKTRVVAHGQQMIRLDRENRAPLEEAVQERVFQGFAASIGEAAAVVISDYGKGLLGAALLQRMMAESARRRVPVVVDPKGTDFARYRGASVITPNTREALRAASVLGGETLSVEEAARRLTALLPETSLLVTRGEEGMSLFAPGGPRVDIPALARQVYDVTGAGDTVVAVLGVALAAGAPLQVAARLANHAAALAVSKLGTATVSLHELQGLFET